MEIIENRSPNPEKYNPKIVFGILFAVLVLLSGACSFVDISINHQELHMAMYEVKGVWLVILGSVFYLYSLFSKNRAFYYVAIIITLMGFGLTTYACLNLNKALGIMPNQIKEYIKFGPGLIFYYLSLGIFLTSILISDKSEKKDESALPDDMKSNLVPDDKYIVVEYIFGIEKRPDLYKKLSILILNGDTLKIVVDAQDRPEVNIPLKDLIGFTSKLGVITTETMETANYDSAKYLRDAAIFGTINAGIISSIKGDRITDYYKNKITKVYDITIEYRVENIIKKIVFQTRENPENFIKLITSKNDLMRG